MEEKSVRIYDTNTTFFRKITNTLNKLFVPTKVGINSFLISLKRNNLLKAYNMYISSNLPKDKKENITFLKEFSSSTQKVISGFSIYYNNSIYSSKSISLVTFNKLEDSKINEYIEKIPTLDKAGGYSYQDDYKFHLINNIKGSTFNIIGLPLEDILDKLKDIN